MLNSVRDICKYIGEVIKDQPFCMETGSTFIVYPENLPKTTTNNIEEYICAKRDGVLYSFDVDEERQKIAASVCPFGKVLFILGDSVQMMSKMVEEWKTDGSPKSIDLLCLDSAEDADHTVNEFMAVKELLNKDKHFVLVDDIHNPSSVKYKKIVPLLKELGYSYVEVPTPTGMFFASWGYLLPEKGER